MTWSHGGTHTLGLAVHFSSRGERVSSAPLCPERQAVSTGCNFPSAACQDPRLLVLGGAFDLPRRHGFRAFYLFSVLDRTLACVLERSW